MTPSLDLDAYFERIQWGGDTRPTYDTLAGLLGAHMLHIPFENLDILLGRAVRLDLDSLQNKIVHGRRGGYCFEQGTLFAAVLEQLGFDLARHTSRVVLFMPRTAAARTHMFLKVALSEGAFVVDPGFGGLAPRVPVPLVDAAAARPGGGMHWMVRDGPYWMLRAQTGDKVLDCWASTFDLDNVVDFEVGNHFTATYSASPFVNRLMMRALTKTGYVAVMNRDCTVWRANVPEPGRLADRGALRALLIEHFGFDLPEVEQLRVPSIPEWA